MVEQTCGDVGSNGKSNATIRVYVWSHESSHGFWKQQNLRYRRDCQKTEVGTHRIWQAEYLYIWNQQTERNHITIIHLNHEVDMVNMVNIKANVVPKISGDMQWMSIPLKNRFPFKRNLS